MAAYTTDSYYETINEFVLKLNYEWFLKKEIKFKKEFYFKAELGKIFHIDKQGSPNYDYDYETGESLPNGNEDISNTIDIDLRRYCSSYLPIDEITDWGNWEYEEYPNPPSPSDNVHEVAYCLVKEIVLFSEELKDVVAISDFVSKTIFSIDEEINRLKETSSGNDIYNGVLADFLKSCSSKLYRKYAKELTVHELTRDFVEKLDFEIDQEEMVSLLYILAASGILKTPTINDHPFISFCFKYFTVQKKGVSVRLTNEKVFINAYRRILRDENGSGLVKIKKKLDPVLKTIIEATKKK